MVSKETTSPYGSGAQRKTASGNTSESAADSGTTTQIPQRIRIHHLQQAKDQGRKFAMLTAYDQYSARIFDEAGIETLLVGDSAANNVYGYETTLPVTVDELLPLCRAVSHSARRALVVADLPFGSYEASAQQAVATGVRFLKEGLAAAVKVEGSARIAPQIRAMSDAGIPVIGHIGFTPQSEHALSGYRVQGRGEDGQRIIDDALALSQAGAFCILMEMVPAEIAAAVEHAIPVPTIGIGAGAATTGQVLVWQDMAGLRSGTGAGVARFVKQYAQLGDELRRAAAQYGEEVRAGQFPGPEHSF